MNKSQLFQHKNVFQYDETPVLKSALDSISVPKVNDYLKRLGQSLIDIENSFSLETELTSLSILIEMDGFYYPTLGGLLAFGKDPQKYFPSYCIACGAYKGKDTTSDVISEKMMKGSLDDQIDDTVSFLKLNMHQDRTLATDTRRKDDYQYPVEALREAVVNAVCHRDYTIAGAMVRIIVLQDRIEIRSPGALPNTLTLESMVYRQFTRNQAVASFLSGLGYMEKRGKGILKIIQSCREKNIAYDFSLTPDNNEFVLTFTK